MERPANLWVSRVIASAHDKATVYVTLNGYRWDDFTAYVYKSDDYGTTWKNIGSSLPASPVNVIVEHPKHSNMLFLGTDNATFISSDSGMSWEILDGGMPPVAVHDLKIQPKENHLLVGTHGRSIYLADLSSLDLLSNLNEEFMTYMTGSTGMKLKLGSIEKMKTSSRYGNKVRTWSEIREPEVACILLN